MSPEERQLLIGLFDRIRGAAANPRDREAEILIDDSVRSQPYAPYLLAQTVLVQDQALRAANDRLQQLEAQLRDQQQQQPPQSGGFLSGLGSLFGAPQPRPSSMPPSGSPWQQSQGFNASPPPPSGGPWGNQPQGGQPSWGNQQQYAPPPPSGMPWGGGAPGGGGSFLHGALGAAAGVAGGVLLADSIRGLFAGHGNNNFGIGSGFAGLGDALPGSGHGETVVNNNYYNDDAATQRAADHQQDINQDQDDDQDAADDPNAADDGYDA